LKIQDKLKSGKLVNELPAQEAICLENEQFVRSTVHVILTFNMIIISNCSGNVNVFWKKI
jgi:hypothetical protein